MKPKHFTHERGMVKDYDYCPDTLTHKHAWYQTTLAKVYRDNDERDGIIDEHGHYYSHACKCGQWRTGHYKNGGRY